MDPEQIPLRDLHLPADIGWWPLAPGWWLLLALLVALLAVAAWRAFQRWRADRARRVALAQLALLKRDFEDKGDVVGLARDLSELLRRGLLAYAPRQSIAGLTGDDWLRWLDRGLEQPLFTAGAGRGIVSLPYQAPDRADAAADAEGLIDAVGTRLRTPLPDGTG